MNKMPENILITGGAGFIGSHLADRLLEKYHHVKIIDNFSPYYSPQLKHQNINHNKGNPSFEIIEGDIKDKDAIKTALKDTEIIYHLASQPGIKTSVDNPQKTNDINVNGTLNILNQMRNTGIKKIIFQSSSSVYGKVKSLPFSENEQKKPVSPYGVSKLACEHYVRVFSELYGFKMTIIRPFTVYGPRMRPDLAIAIFTKNALKNEPITIFGDGNQTRDFTHVNNVVDANIRAMTKGDAETFDIGTGRAYSVNDLIEKIIKITGSASKIIHTDKRQGDTQNTLADTSKAKKILGWEPKISLDEGLKDYTEWFKSDPNNNI